MKERVKQFRMESLALSLALLLPLSYTFLWLHINHQLPISDATDYLRAAYISYENFIKNGLLHFHFDRGWRPIFFPVLSWLFLLVSKGNLYFAYKAVAISCLIVSEVYIYLLCRLVLTRTGSIIATSFVGLLPWVQTPLLTFFAESALFPFLFGSLYHLLKSNYLEHPKHRYGFIVCYSLALIIRPIEAITHMVPILILFCVKGWHKGFFQRQQLILLIISVTFATMVLSLIIVLHFLDHYPGSLIEGSLYDQQVVKTIYKLTKYTLYALLVLNTILLLSKVAILQKNQQHPVFVAIFFPVLISLCWFAPYAFATFIWIYRTSIGDLATIGLSTIVKQSLLNQLYSLSISGNEFIMYGLGLITFITIIIFVLIRQSRLIFSDVILYLLLLTPFSIWEVLFTVQNTPRKLSIAFPALIMAWLMISLRKGKFDYFRQLIVSTILIIQFVMIINPLLFYHWPINTEVNNYPKPNRLIPDAHQQVLSFLETVASTYHLKNIDIESNIETGKPVDPYLLQLLGLIQKRDFKLSHSEFRSYNPKNLQDLFKNDAVLLLDNKEAHASIYRKLFLEEKNPTLKTRYELLFHLATHELKQIGWKQGPCFKFDGNYGCILLHISVKNIK